MSDGTIDIEEFENADADKFEERNDTERIVCFLDKHDDRAWKAATIADQLGLETDAVSAILSRLKERGLVRHKRP
jgi:predicted ArsR family transcriptional regulator